MASEKMLVGRHKRVAFMDADGSGKTFTRMTGLPLCQMERTQQNTAGSMWMRRLKEVT